MMYIEILVSLENLFKLIIFLAMNETPCGLLLGGVHENIKINLTTHKGALDTFPTNLEFIRMMSENVPLFKEVEE